jgi:hypothetical protein
MSEYRIITIQGFDIDGEPEMRLYSNDKIELVFNFMPPCNGNPDGIQDPIFDDFEDILQKELGVLVERDDREFFTIQSGDSKTVNRLKEYLESFWSNYHPSSQPT